MARIKWKVDYASYKAGQELDVDDLANLKKHIEAGRIEVLKAKAETGTTPKGETTSAKTEPKHK